MRQCNRKSVSTGEFGAYRGLARVLKSPSNPQNCRKKEKNLEKSTEFGAYRGLALVLKSPSNPQNCRKKEKNLEKDTFIFCAKLWYAANPGSKENQMQRRILPLPLGDFRPSPFQGLKGVPLRPCNLRGHLQRCQMPDIENSRKTAEKGEWVRQTAEKQPEKQPKHPKNSCFDCFSGVSAVFPAVFRLLYCGPTRNAFRLFSMSGISHLCRWPRRLQPLE